MAKTEINKKKEELEQAKFALAQAENNYDLEKVQCFVMVKFQLWNKN